MNHEPRKLRVGVLGCGPISQAAHFTACHKAHDAELYAICDQAEDLVSRMTALHEPQISYLDYDQMLADPLVEAIIVAIADQFHVEAAHKALAAGSDGNVWLTEREQNKIGKITPKGIVTEFPVPTKASGPWGITAGPDGNVWFTEVIYDHPGRIAW
jgi:hypothetical protein